MDAILSKDQVKKFHKEGYLIIPSVLNKSQIEEGRDIYKSIISKTINSKYPYKRMFHRGSFNVILGVEQLFSPEMYDSKLLKMLQQSKILDYCKHLLNTEDLVLILHRLICTYKVSFSGAWHRDGDVNQFIHLQSALLFYPETGFKIIPGSHLLQDSELGVNNIIKGTKKLIDSDRKLENEITICGNAGDLILFHSSILHRGSCVGWGKYQRAQIHLRIGPLKRNNELAQELIGVEREEVISKASKDWQKLFSNRKINQLGEQPLHPNHSINKITKTIHEGLYYLSRFISPEKYFGKSYLSCRYLSPNNKYEHFYID